MFTVEIESKPDADKKTRSFKSTCLGVIEANHLCDFTSSDSEMKPLWAMFVGSENEIKPFIVNLLLGNKSIIDNGSYSRRRERIVCPKSAGYKVTWQKEEEASIATVFLPDYFLLDPGMIDPNFIKFVVMPSVDWCAKQKIDTKPIIDYISTILPISPSGFFSEENLTNLVPIAFLFCAYLDRRTRCPLVADGKFYMQLLIASLVEGLAFLPKDTSKYYPYGAKKLGISYSSLEGPPLESLGLAGGISFSADHIQLETLLAKEVDTYFRKVAK